MNEHPDGGTSQAGKRPRPQWLIPAVVVVVLAVLGAVFAGIPDAYENLFFKSRYALRYLHERLPDFDWFLKVTRRFLIAKFQE